MNWYLLRFKSQYFTAVFNHLVTHEIEYFCPMIETHYLRPDKRQSFRKRVAPAFPGYLFVNLDFDHCHPQKLAAHPRIYKLIEFGNGPSPIDDSVIDLLMAKPPVVRDIIATPEICEDSDELDRIIAIRDDTQRIAALLHYLQSRQLPIAA